MKKFKRGARGVAPVVGAFLTAAVVLAGCSSAPAPAPLPSGTDTATDAVSANDLDQLAADARAEGSITIYTATAEDKLREWVQPFLDEYQLSLEVYKASTNPVNERFVQEAEAGSNFADVVILSDDRILAEDVSLNLLADYTPASSSDFAGAGGLDVGYYYPLYQVIAAVGYNTSLLSAADVKELQTKGLIALADPKYQGKLASSNAHNSTNNTAFYYALANLNEGLGWDYLEKLGANQPRLYDGSPPMIQALVAGEFAVALLAPDTVVAPQVIAGAPIEFLYPDVTPVTAFSSGISAYAPHPAAARLFQEWATQAKNQTALSSISQGAAGNPMAIDSRVIANENWYQAPKTGWFWSTDPKLDFSTVEQDTLTKWDEAFNYIK